MNALPLARTSAAATPLDVGSTLRRWLSRTRRSLYGALLASGQARAQAELLSLADRWQSLHPDLATELRAACAHIAKDTA